MSQEITVVKLGRSCHKDCQQQTLSALWVNCDPWMPFMFVVKAVQLIFELTQRQRSKELSEVFLSLAPG